MTHVLSAALVWDIPVGKGRKYLDKGGATNAILGGWELSTIFRYSSGMPVLLPVQLLQRARAVPGGLHPHEQR